MSRACSASPNLGAWPTLPTSPTPAPRWRRRDGTFMSAPRYQSRPWVTSTRRAETEFLLQDLRDNIDGFDDHARILNIAIPRDDWPPQRAVAGFDLPHDTPFAGLWNVGDAVKEYANGGTTACAETAKLVVDKIVAAHRPAVMR